MPVSGSQLSSAKRPKWVHATIGVFLIVVTVALTLGWLFLGSEQARAAREVQTARLVVYFFGTILFLLLLAGLGLFKFFGRL